MSAGIEAAVGHLLLEEVRRIAQETALAAVTAQPAATAVRPLPSRWVTPPVAARETGVPVKTVRAMIKAGLVKPRLRNRSATTEHPKFLVNVEQVTAAAERFPGEPPTLPDSSSDSTPIDLEEHARRIRAGR